MKKRERAICSRLAPVLAVACSLIGCRPAPAAGLHAPAAIPPDPSPNSPDAVDVGPDDAPPARADETSPDAESSSDTGDAEAFCVRVKELMDAELPSGVDDFVLGCIAAAEKDQASDAAGFAERSACVMQALDLAGMEACLGGT